MYDLPPPPPTGSFEIPSGYPFPPPQIQQLITLPKDILYKILSELKPSDLAKICKSHTQLAKICNDSNFWKFKHLQTFKNLPSKPNPKTIYYHRLRDINRELNQDLVKKLTEVITSVTGNNYVYRTGLALAVSGNFSPTFMEFEREILNHIKYLIQSIYINPNAEIFKQYPIDQFGSPLSALLKALYDIKSEYQREIIQLRNEIEDLKNLNLMKY